jgi:hypothetical protein
MGDINLLLQHKSDLGTLRIQSQLLYMHKWNSMQSIGLKSRLTSWANATCYTFRNQLQHNLPWYVRIIEIIFYWIMFKVSPNKRTQTLQLFHAKCQNSKIQKVALITWCLYDLWTVLSLCDSDVTITPTIRSYDRANLTAMHCSITHIEYCLSVEFADYMWQCKQLCDVLHQSKIIKIYYKLLNPNLMYQQIRYNNIKLCKCVQLESRAY